MNQDYTVVSDLGMGGGTGMKMMPQQQQQYQSQMQQQFPPAIPPPSQFDMIKRYLDDSDESDSESESEEEPKTTSKLFTWQHFYGIATLTLLVAILYYVFKIRAELTGMYEEA